MALILDSVFGFQGTFQIIPIIWPSAARALETFGFSLNYLPGDGEIRTLDPLLARQVLSQLSYTPMVIFTNQKRQTVLYGFLGLNGLEPSTSRLSGVRSNQLSYNPMMYHHVSLYSFFI